MLDFVLKQDVKLILSLNVTITFKLYNVHFIRVFTILEHEILGASGDVTVAPKNPTEFGIPKKILDTSLTRFTIICNC